MVIWNLGFGAGEFLILALNVVKQNFSALNLSYKINRTRIILG